MAPGINPLQGCDVLELLAPTALAAAAAGTTTGPSGTTGLDVSKYVGTGYVILYATGMSASDTIDWELRESATTNGTYTLISAAQAMTAVAQVTDAATAATKTQVIQIPDVDALKGFIRALAVVAGTTITGVFGALFVGKKRYA